MGLFDSFHRDCFSRHIKPMRERSIILVVLALFLSGCSFFSSKSFEAIKPIDITVEPWRVIDRAQPGEPGGTLRVSEFGSGPKTFNPIVANESSTNDITVEDFSSLMDYDF